MRNARFAIVGARRVRQGLGPFIARFLDRYEIDVIAVIGTRLETAKVGSDQLRQEYGIETRPFDSLAAAHAHTPLDGVVIASPVDTHETYLQQALELELHVLAEKPLLAPGRGAVERCLELTSAFEQRGLLLVENIQWPYVVKTFRELYPQWEGGVSRFAMRMSPMTVGRQMLDDSLSHPISLLEALLPQTPPQAREISFEPFRHEDGGEGLRVAFDYGVPRSSSRPVELHFVRCPKPPRPAWVEIEGLRGIRQIRMPSYQMVMETPPDVREPRFVPMDDPLEALIKDFCGRLYAALEGDEVRSDKGIYGRYALFHGILEAYSEAFEEESV